MDLAELESSLDDIRAAPKDAGRVALIVRRPSVEEREVLGEATLDERVGLVGDCWSTRGSSSTADGGPHPQRQVTMMNARVALAVAGPAERWPVAGDQLYVDLDLSVSNLPPGTRLEVGSALLEVTEEPHLGCRKFVARFGNDALRFVNSRTGRELNLRGINTRVLQGRHGEARRPRAQGARGEPVTSDRR